MAQAYRIPAGDVPDSGVRLSRDQLRSKRKRLVRAHTTSLKQMSKTSLEIGRQVYSLDEHPAPMHGGPRVRSECAAWRIPCSVCGVSHEASELGGSKIPPAHRNGPGSRQDRRQVDSSDVGVPVRLRWHHCGEGDQSQNRQHQVVRVQKGKARTAKCARVRGVADNVGTVQQSKAQVISRLWRTRDQGLRALDDRGEFLCRHGSASECSTYDRANQQQRQLRAKQLPVGNHGRAVQKPSKLRCGHCGGTGLEFVRVGAEDGDWIVDHQGAAAAWLVSGTSRVRTRKAAPCPWVSCKWNLYLDVVGKGSIKFNFPDVDWDEIPHSCALDIADLEGATLEEVSECLNYTRERCRQVEVVALQKVASFQGGKVLSEYWDEEGPIGRRRLPIIDSVESADDEDIEEIW